MGDNAFFEYIAKGSYVHDHGNNDEQEGYAMIANAARNTTTPNRPYSDYRNRTLKEDGTLNKIKFTYNDKSYYLAPKPSPNMDAETKAMHFDDTVAEISASTNTWEEKTNAVVSHYSLQSLRTMAEESNAGVNDPSSTLYTWTFRSLRDANFAVVGNPANDGDPLPNTVRYIAFDVNIASPAPLTLSVRPESRVNVLVRLAESVLQPGNRHPNYTWNNVRDYDALVRCTTAPPAAGAQADNPPAPLIGLRKNDDNPFSPSEWDKFIKNYFYQCVFHTALTGLKRAVVGESAIRTVDQRLQELKQSKMVNGKKVYTPVQEFFESFSRLNNDKGKNAWGNIASTFFHNLDETVRNYLVSNMNYLPPAASVGHNTGDYNNLLTLKDLATRAEKAIKQQYEVSMQVHNQQRGRGTTTAFATRPLTSEDHLRAFMGTPERPPKRISHSPDGHLNTNTYGYYDPYGQEPRREPDLLSMFAEELTKQQKAASNPGYSNPQAYLGQPQPPASTTYGYYPSPPQVAPTNNIGGGDMALAQAFLAVTDATNYVDVYDKAEQIIAQAQAFVSTAEKAMRTASGMRAPMECWGCKDDPRFHNNRFHRFANCPNKNDEEVRRRAETIMKKLFGDRTRNPKKRDAAALAADVLTPQEIKTGWKDLGFKSSAQANMVCALMSRSTPKRTRKKFTLIEDNNPEESDYMTLVTIPVLETVPKAPLDLTVTRYLPHVNFPFGVGNERFTIKIAVDSCAGLNLGSLDYHRGIIALFPSAVVSFVDLRDTNQEIPVGGVGKGGTSGLVVTHVVVYRTVLKAGNVDARVAFGLSEQAAASALVGIGFLQKTKAVVSFANNEDPSLVMAPLGLTLPIAFETPSVRPTPKGKDSSQAYTLIPAPRYPDYKMAKINQGSQE